MGIKLKRIEVCDLEDIIRWRMDEDITRYMNTNPRLTLEGQRKWLESIKENPDVEYRLIEIDSQKAGVISINGLMNPEGKLGWAYYIGEKRLRGIKTALALEMSLYDHIFDTLHKKVLYGDIFTLNKGVIQLHLLCGSEIVEEKKNHIFKEGVFYDVTIMSITAERWREIKGSKKYEKVEFG